MLPYSEFRQAKGPTYVSGIKRSERQAEHSPPLGGPLKLQEDTARLYTALP